MKTLIRAILIVGGGIASPVLAADGVCDLEDSLKSCNDDIEAQVNASMAEPETTVESAEAAAKAAVAEVPNTLATRNTGMPQATSEGTASTFADFFSTFKAAADASPGGEEEDDGAMAFEFTNCLLPRRPNSRFQCQGRLLVGGAQLYEPLKLALPEATRDDRAGELEKDLSFGDSMTLGIFFNLVGDKFGRVPRFSTEKLFTDLLSFAQAESAAGRRAANERTEKVVAQIKTVQRADPALKDFNRNTPFTTIAAINPELASETLKLSEELARAELDSLVEFRQLLIDSRYFDLVDLVNNQAQLNFGVEYAQRADLAGPDEWRAKLIYEGGFVNVSTAHEFVYGGDCDEGQLSTKIVSSAGKAVGCLQQYLDRKDVQAQLKNGSRYLLSMEYVARKKFSAVLPTDAIDFSQEAEKSLIASAGYGRYLDFDDAGDPRSRIDVKGSYEDVRSDPARQDRGVLTATYSQKVIGSTVLSVSLVYGTKPEFRGEVDEEISAHVGFNYKLGKSETF